MNVEKHGIDLNGHKVIGNGQKRRNFITRDEKALTPITRVGKIDANSIVSIKRQPVCIANHQYLD